MQRSWLGAGGAGLVPELTPLDEHPPFSLPAAAGSHDRGLSACVPSPSL